jgi:hypothetical protein
MARHLTTASNQFEAEIILSRLREADINAWESSNVVGRFGLAGPQDIYVEDDDIERAQKVLRDAQDVNEEELDELAERDSGTGER